MIDLLNMTPINKTASIVVNQCGCSDDLQLNGLVDENQALKANMRFWLNSKRTRERKREIVRINKDLQRLSTRLSPYYRFHQKKKANTREQALMIVIDHYLPEEVCKFIKKEALALLD